MRPANPLCLLLAVLVVLGFGCENDAPLTQIRVVVDSDLEVGAELTKLEVRVYDRAGETELRRQDFALGDVREGARFALPMSFKLAPDTQRSTSDFRLVVTGVGPLGQGGSDTEVVEQQALVSFRPGEALRLDVFLGRSCLLKLCRDNEDEKLSGLTCDVESGACVAVPLREDLPQVSGDGVAQYQAEKDAGAVTSEDDTARPASDAASSALDAGLPEIDAVVEASAPSDVLDAAHRPSAMDAQAAAEASLVTSDTAVDLGPDTAVSAEDAAVDATTSGDDAQVEGVAVIGSPCLSVGLKACGGHNSADALVCESGAWRLRTVCDGDTRCDSGPSATRGTCQRVLPECVGEQPTNNVCVDANRYKCGPDLLTLSPAPCPQNATCVDGSCFCSPGYVPNAQRSGCVEADVPLQVAGGSLSCVRLKSGRVACWKAGALPSPALVRDPSDAALTNAKYIAVGEGGGCAVLSDGRALCWGSGSFVPASTPGNLLRGSFVTTANGTHLGSLTQVAVGGAHACAVSSDSGVYCWGANNQRQLGTGSTQASVGFAERVVGVGGTGSLSDVMQVAAGALHSCARLTGARLVCWGSNAAGQLGVSTAWPATPTALAPFGNPLSVSSSALASSTCAVLGDGSVRCWGANPTGQLGTGNTQSSPTPTAVLVASGVALSGTVEVALGASTACARTAATVSCWGLNDHGQLGQPFTTQQSLFAVAVPGLTGAVHLGQSALSTNCVIDAAKQVQCWGAATMIDNMGAGHDSFEPVLVWPAWDYQ